jgi:hypothetical protein
VARQKYGYRAGEIVAAVDGTTLAYEKPSSALTFSIYTDFACTTHETDLQDENGAAVTVVPFDSVGRMPFQGKDGYTGAYWGRQTGTSGIPYLFEPSDLASRATGGVDLSGYQTTAAKDTANGYAGLNGSTQVPIAEVPTGITSTTVSLGNHNHTLDSLSDVVAPSHAAGSYLRDDGANWQVVAGINGAEVSGLAAVAYSGAYGDLSGGPGANMGYNLETGSGYAARPDPAIVPYMTYLGPSIPPVDALVNRDIWGKTPATFSVP